MLSTPRLNDDNMIHLDIPFKEKVIDDLFSMKRTPKSLEDIEKALTDRERNVYEIINLNYLGDVVGWESYYSKWEAKVDHDSKRIMILDKSTVVNNVRFPEPKLPPTTVAKAVKAETPKTSTEINPELLAKIQELIAKEQTDG